MNEKLKNFDDYVSLVERIKSVMPPGLNPVDVLAVAGFLASEAIMKIPPADRMDEFSGFVAIISESIDVVRPERKEVTCH
jgi:hypothetical protein